MTEQAKIRFLVSGRAQAAEPSGQRLVYVSPGTRDAAERRELAATVGEDVVALKLMNGPDLWLHPETARDLFLAQRSGSGFGPAATRSSSDDAVNVAAQLVWAGGAQLARASGSAASNAGQALLHALEIRSDRPDSTAAELAATLLATSIDQAVVPGLHRLDQRLGSLSGTPEIARADGPILVLMHGAFSSTAGAFRQLWDRHPDGVGKLLDEFQGRVYGFEHATLQASPIENALQLMQWLPDGAQLHLLTHSRGGLVAEVLAQVAGRVLGDEDWAALAAPKYQAHREQLRELAKLVRKKGLSVARIVRVACPARGTLLASQRLDAYLSVLRWGLELAQVPVAPLFLDFLWQVAKTRTDPETFPGLEAMMPGSGFMKWLHRSAQPIAGELRVVAGDMQADSISSWLKTLLAEAYFWTDSDLIVQTRSMYGGSPRKGGASYFLERAGSVSHFNYFANPRSAEAVVRALTEDEPAGFQAIGLLSAQGLSSSGGRGGADAVARASTGPRPTVFVLPGILGSHLRVADERIWLSPRVLNGLTRLAYGVDGTGVEPDGVLDGFYGGLSEHLSASHDVVSFDFDWRLPIQQEARRLGQQLNEKLRASPQPVRILAHSMGGLLARALQLELPHVWDAFIARSGARLLMLGTPNAGSWVPMQVLSGDHLLGNVLTFFGALFDDVKGRQLFADLPGFVQLQAGLLQSELRLSTTAGWSELAEKDRALWQIESPWHRLEIQKRAADWGIPSQHILTSARELHERLAQQDLGAYGNRVLMVVGHARRTPSGFELGKERFDYLATERGDGTVPLASALLPKVRTWQVAVEHGSLARPRELYAGYTELLESGATMSAAFADLRLAYQRSGATVADHPEQASRVIRSARIRGWSEDALNAVDLALELAPRDTTSDAAPVLQVSVINGDLTFVKEPLLMGHYRSLRLTGAEGAMDRFLKGLLSQALRLGRYPTELAESDVFRNHEPHPDHPLGMPRPSAVIVAGLGTEGELRAEALTQAVRKAVIGYAQRLAEERNAASSFELASTLLGSGGIGISVATSARAVARGVRAANVELLKEHWPIVARLLFVEWYEDRGIEALRELAELAEHTPGHYQVETRLRSGARALLRPEMASYRGAQYDVASALDGPKEEGQSTIAFTVDTRRARTEVRSSSTKVTLLSELIAEAESDRQADGRFGKTLFQVLVPAELDSFFGNSEAVVLEVDDKTAGIPWEILNVGRQENVADDKPWAIRTQLVRKLRSTTFRERPDPAGRRAGVLVFGDPHCDDRKLYPELEGARREARAVAKVLGVGEPLIQAKASVMIHALLDQPYQVVHIAGHGRADGGVVMSGNQILGHELVSKMRRVPDLVFVNCCHSGQALPFGEATGAGRPERAANIARALVRIGVRCVVAAGWAVDDDAAEHFSHEFYRLLCDGVRFAEASSRARESTWREFRYSNTWAAYQCYGDPDWVLLRDTPSQAARVTPVATEREPLVASASTLIGALKTIAVLGQDQGQEQQQRARLERLDRELGVSLGKLGEVAEHFGKAYSDLGAQEQAVTWYRRAVEAENGGASSRALEQWCNMTVRLAAARAEVARQQWERDGDVQAFVPVVAAALPAFDRADAELSRLAAIHLTYERANLLGSVWKRRAIVAYAVSRVAPSTAAEVELRIARMKTVEHCRHAEGLALQQGLEDLYYPLLNRMTAEAMLDLDKPAHPADEDGVEQVQNSLERKIAQDPDFWALAQRQELKLYQGLCQRNIAAQSEEVKRGFRELRSRIRLKRSWSTLRDQTWFTLRPYASSAQISALESKAADDLIALLEAFARGEEAL